MYYFKVRIRNLILGGAAWTTLSFIWCVPARAAQPMEPFGIGTHWNEHQYYQLAKDAGIEWLRLDINWAHVQPNSANEWNWSNVDTAINKAESLGLKVLAIMSYSTSWSRSGGDINFAHREEFDDAYKTQLATIVNRYKDRVDAWEVMNEPDHNNFLKIGTGTWASNNHPTASATDKRRLQYMHMMDLATTALAPYRSEITLTTSGYANGGNHDAGFIDHLAQQPGFFAKHDVFNGHAYGYPSYTPLKNKITEYETIRDQQMPGAPIWITEHGITNSSPDNPPADAGRYMVRSYATALASGADKLFWFRHMPGGDHVTLLKSNGQPSILLPIYGVMTAHWNDPLSVTEITGITGVEGAIAYRMDGQQVAIVWSDQAQPIALGDLPFTFTQAFDMWGNGITVTSFTTLSANPTYLYLGTSIPEPASCLALFAGAALALVRRAKRPAATVNHFLKG